MSISSSKDNDLHTFYTPFYCEENIYKLIKALINPPYSLSLDDFHVLFISNQEKHVPFWNQKQCINISTPIIWDYHVILIHEMKSIYDYDCLLSFPVNTKDYISNVFHIPNDQLDFSFQRIYRLVPAFIYLTHFASDRSHMILSNGNYSAPPPPFQCIETKAEKMNLDKWINVLDTTYGTLLSEKELFDKLEN